MPEHNRADAAEIAAFRALFQRIVPGSWVRRVTRLSGGVSAVTTALEVDFPDDTLRRFVARQHGAANVRANPHSAQDEFHLLQIAHAHGLPVPAPFAWDDGDGLFPHPVLIVEHIDGDAVFEPDDLADFLRQSAGALARIHQLGESPQLAFLPRDAGSLPQSVGEPDHALQEGRIRDALRGVGWPTPINQPTLLHGDFWPGNLLWREYRLVAVIDWEDARVGDPLADLANARLELLFFLGQAAPHDFTAAYLAVQPLDLTHLPYWDLRAALRPCGKLATWGLDAATEERIRQRHRAFVTQALSRLG